MQAPAPIQFRFEDHPLQDEVELEQFTNLARAENVKSYLEIGSAWGGSIWRMAAALPENARIVAVDAALMPKNTRPSLEQCIRRLRARKFDAHVFIGNSTDAIIIKQVSALGPFDLCLIDGDHSLPFVTADWENYGSLARIVAFHDISFLPIPKQLHELPVDVPQFWQKLKQNYRHKEFRNRPDQLGIGVLWKN